MIEEIDAAAELARGFDKFAPVKAAFWVMTSDDRRKYFYLASDRIDDWNFDIAYKEIAKLVGEIRSPYIDPLRIHIINSDTPLVRAAVEINRRYPGPMGTRFGGDVFGGVSVDEVYVYPSPLPAAS